MCVVLCCVQLSVCGNVLLKGFRDQAVPCWLGRSNSTTLEDDMVAVVGWIRVQDQ